MIARFFILCLIVNIVIKNLNLKKNVVYIKDYVNLDPIMKNKLKNDVMVQELHQNIILEKNYILVHFFFVNYTKEKWGI